MTFNDFRRTRQIISAKLFAEKMGVPIGDIEAPFVLVYREIFYIEFNPKDTNPFYLVLDRKSYCDSNLEMLESLLFHYAKKYEI